MVTLNIMLIGIIVVLGITLGVVWLEYNEIRASEELPLHDKPEIEELVDTFKEKYSNYKITEFPDSKGIPYKYSAHVSNGEVDLIFEKDRILLRAWINDEPLCIVSNPFPRDILNNCPLKW